MKSDIEAIEIAKNYISQIYTKKLDILPTVFEVEEVINDNTECHITISFRSNNGDTGTVANLIGGIKKYKQVTVDKISGQVKSMKIKAL